MSVVTTMALVALACAPAAGARPEPAAQVRAAELAFARSMAERDHGAFAAHVSEEAVFLSAKVLRGRAAVAEGWRPYFQGAEAPFSWEPEQVQVLDSGGLAISTGPVRDPKGRRIGTFSSIWRLEPDGRWRVVFDNGCPPCDCGSEAAPRAGDR